MPSSYLNRGLFIGALSVVLVAASVGVAFSETPQPFTQLANQYQQQIHPLLKTFCLDCHSTADKQGELDLEQFASLAAVRKDPARWQGVRQMLKTGEMPPEDSDQLSTEQHKQLAAWIDRYLTAEAQANAGDPGPVVLRRLNNAEYTYTIQDLTGVPLEPAKEFPVDGAAGEGFTNTGNALVMSPSLVQKYLDAGKEIAQHVVLLPDGFRFSPGTTRRDWTDEILADIRGIYFKHIRDVGNAHALDRWNVSDPKRIMAQEGRVYLVPYFAALIEHRDQLQADLAQAPRIAEQSHLNAKYFTLLAEMLCANEPASPLLEDLRQRYQTVNPAQAQALADSVRSWQDVLWKFNSVGHFGSIRPSQEAITTLVPEKTFRVPITGSEPFRPHLHAVKVIGDNASDSVIWEKPRIERKGLPPIVLHDLPSTIAAMQSARKEVIEKTPRYLAAAWQIQHAGGEAEPFAVAVKRNLHSGVLQQWLTLLGISWKETLPPIELLPQAINNAGGKANVSGWGSPGLDALSIVGNAGDETVYIPGELKAHGVAMHPRPERWIAAAWQCPVDGTFDITAIARDAHNSCGNGATWWLEHHRPGSTIVLQSGNIDLGRAAEIEPITKLALSRGDRIALKIGARDANHFCDLTEVNLTLHEHDGEARTWDLAADCSADLSSANPHPDRHGNLDTWVFYSGSVDGQPSASALPKDSLLAQWQSADSEAVAKQLAQQIDAKIKKAAGTDPLDDADYLYVDLIAWNGPLVAGAAQPGRAMEVLTSPSAPEIDIPGELFEGAEFVVTAKPKSPQSVVQVSVTTNTAATLSPEATFLGDAQNLDQLKRIHDDYRHYFPAIVCYPQIVPVDEVVTLVLFHREDQELARLMLSEEEQARLDKLWKQLRYVSRDALDITVSLEQLLEFATQDGDPTIFHPLLEPIKNRATEFRQQLINTEPIHLERLLGFASGAYRRSLTDQESQTINDLYAQLRSQQLSHDEAIRLSIARILASPAFLYRIETPGPGTEPGKLSGHELATRLSYFLWSSTPDASLRQAAASGTLHTPDELLAHTQRMLKDDRSRRLAIQFACQWLHIRDFDTFDEKSEQHYPQFAELRGDMYQESVLFLEDLLRNNGSILDILQADHTFLNESLAKHYGIPGVTGEQWRKVEGIRQYGRGGILGQATVLAKNSGASRTSPILRGNWISETLLGERLPRPPLNVPVLPEVAPEGLTERQLIEMHSSVSECAKCHKRIDPYGFALEQFDTIGTFRSQDAHGLPIDTKSTLMDGTDVDGLAGIRNYLATARRETFVRQFNRKLLGYALGRSVQLSDEPLLDEIYQALTENDFRVHVAIEKIVLSPQFRQIRGQQFVGLE
ncbi:hypothetical protein C5Y96_10400 [Blastopirellula marina]|uniref:Haem-binding domain-containing protein n=1 Tax=Blastopirellula marina TaxID=124 RepID=A0A2S8FM54_9BACT|nr:MULTISPECIES: DUF1592 domain-containing protein [Pirellulaceae]PQO33255.1 hypothetical protein C5Y96_10400 [Blastopirellula marina]RCS52344.1 DUF1592 domain-containing protein [Bremerella cremea]